MVSDWEELETRSNTVSHCTKSIKNNTKGERFVTPSTYSVMCCGARPVVVAKEVIDGRRKSLMSERKFECNLSYKLFCNDVGQRQ